jgi:hypothetical protein
MLAPKNAPSMIRKTAHKGPAIHKRHPHRSRATT